MRKEQQKSNTTSRCRKKWSRTQVLINLRHHCHRTGNCINVSNNIQTRQLLICCLPLFCRHLVVHQPFLSKNRLPPTQFFLGTGSSSFRKPNSDLAQSQNEKKPLETVTEDKTEIMPEILLNSPIANIKAISPNSKRVSPPQPGSSESGSILRRRGNGRKLILRSIPAFPSLNPNQ